MVKTDAIQLGKAMNEGTAQGTPELGWGSGKTFWKADCSSLGRHYSKQEKAQGSETAGNIQLTDRWEEGRTSKEAGKAQKPHQNDGETEGV